MKKLVSEHLAEQRAMANRHKAQVKDLQDHIDKMLASHHKDLRELTKQNEDAQTALMADHRQYLKEQEDKTRQAILQERSDVKASMFKEQQKQQAALQDADNDMKFLEATLQQIENRTLHFVCKQSKFQLGLRDIERLRYEINEVSEIADRAVRESKRLLEAHVEQRKHSAMISREVELRKRELNSREAEITRLVVQLQRREQAEEDARSKSSCYQVQVARLQGELERSELELRRVREELNFVRSGRGTEQSRMENISEAVDRSLALSRELVLKERELKSVESRLRESELATERLEALVEELEREENSAAAVLARMEPGELEALQREVVELKQAVQQKEEEVLHWQGEGLAAEEDMGRAIKALQDSKTRVEREAEGRLKLQEEVSHLGAALACTSNRLHAKRAAKCVKGKSK